MVCYLLLEHDERLVVFKLQVVHTELVDHYRQYQAHYNYFWNQAASRALTQREVPPAPFEPPPPDARTQYGPTSSGRFGHARPCLAPYWPHAASPSVSAHDRVSLSVSSHPSLPPSLVLAV